MKGKERRGGARKGAGRPKKARPSVPPPSIDVDWAAVERFANVGASEEEIIAGLAIPDVQTKTPEVAQRLRQLVLVGNARKDLLLREAIDRLGKGETRGGGYTLALEARNRLGWDKQQEQQEAPPDLTSAHARLRLTLERLAAVRSESLGRVVTPAELLFGEVLDPDAVKH